MRNRSGEGFNGVNDPRVPFNGIIEFTNLNPIGPDAGHIIYVPYYIATDHPFYKMDNDTILRQSWDAVKLISPGITDDDLLAHHVARAPIAQAICPVGFLNMLPLLLAVAGAMGEQSLEDWKFIMDINLWGVIHGCHVFAPRLKARRRGHRQEEQHKGRQQPAVPQDGLARPTAPHGLDAPRHQAQNHDQRGLEGDRKSTR